MEEIQFEQLMKDNHKMIYSIINDVVYEDFISDYAVCKDDLYQEGCIALYNAFLTYDSNAGAKFSTYAYLLIRRRLVHKCREYIRPILFEKYSVDAVREVDRLSYFTSYDYEPKEEHDFSNIEKFRKTLSDSENTLINHRQNKVSYKKIAEAMGLTTKQVDNKLANIKRKYRQYLEKEKKPNGSSCPEHCI